MSASSLFNGSVTASAVCAAVQLDLLDEVRDNDKVDVDVLAVERDLHVPSLRAVVNVLVNADILEILQPDPIVVAKGGAFDDVWQNKGYFFWLVRGYGEMLSQVADFCDNTTRRKIDLMLRDGRAIAQAGRDYGGHFVDPIVDRIITSTDFTVGADLGCGSAGRIIRLARRYPDKRFLGVDVDAGAVAVAREAVASASLADRIEIVHDDVRDLAERPEYADVDLALSFFLGHDFWPRADCLETLGQIRRRLPKIRNFLFSDTYRSPDAATQDAPIFTLGFELTHALMGQHVPTAEEWCGLFAESVWDLQHRWTLDIPYSEVFQLVPSAD